MAHSLGEGAARPRPAGVIGLSGFIPQGRGLRAGRRDRAAGCDRPRHPRPGHPRRVRPRRARPAHGGRRRRDLPRVADARTRSTPATWRAARLGRARARRSARVELSRACPRPRRRRGRRRAPRACDAQQQVARAVVAGHVAHALEQLALEQHRVARARRRRWRAPRRRPRARAAITRADRVRRQARLVAERDHHGLAVRPARPARRRATPTGPPPSARTRRNSAPCGSTPAITSSAPAPSTTTTRLDAATPSCARIACSSSGRPSSSASCLRAAEARARAGRRGRARRSRARPRGCGPPAVDSRPPSRPCRTATTSAMIESAVSSGVIAPRSSPIGAAMRSSSSSSSPAASSRSRRCAWARRLPIAPT